MKNVLTSSAKSDVLPLGLMVAASVRDAAIQKKICGSEITTLIIHSEEMNDIMKIVKSLEESGLLMKVVCEIFENEAEEQKGRFLVMLLDAIAATSL